MALFLKKSLSTQADYKARGDGKYLRKNSNRTGHFRSTSEIDVNIIQWRIVWWVPRQRKIYRWASLRRWDVITTIFCAGPTHVEFQSIVCSKGKSTIIIWNGHFQCTIVLHAFINTKIFMPSSWKSRLIYSSRSNNSSKAYNLKK